MSFHVDIDAGIDFIRFVRRLTGNTRGRASRNTIQNVDTILGRLQTACEGAARMVLRFNLSDGPPLAFAWQRRKKRSWNNDNPTMPSFAVGPEHKGVWSGFLDSQLTSWRDVTGTIAGPNQVRVGFRGHATHPIDGVDIIDLASWIHFGTSRAPARPFISNSLARAEYVARAIAIVSTALSNMITMGAP